VKEIADCYAALGLVHTRWAPIAAEFDDYIAKPKANLYRSLHTAVIGPQGRTMEVQIRTRAMHHHADLGVAAHWRYKEGLQQRLDWSRRFLEGTEHASGGHDLIERFRHVAFHDRIYVLTPQGRIIDLPVGATALDFAYAVHTDVGHRCRGAKVDGAIVPLTQGLASGQQVEILTARIGAPSRDWLNLRRGYLKTDSARAKIRRWFKEQDREQHIAQGRVVLERERRRMGLTDDVNLTVLAKRFGLKQPEDLLATLGSGNMTVVQLDQALAPMPAPVLPTEPAPASAAPPAQAQAMLVQGISNLLTRVAHCCRPVPGEPIIGYITQSQGVTIHRRGCPNVARLGASRPQRIMEVAWGDGGQSSPVQIELVADDRRGLLRDVSETLSSEKTDIQAVNTASNAQTGTAVMTFQVLILDIAQLQRVLNRLSRIRGVRQLRRL
jgi:GTP pyrophosphokinase